MRWKTIRHGVSAFSRKRPSRTIWWNSRLRDSLKRTEMSTSIRPATEADALDISGKGSYVLVLRLDAPHSTDVGKLGRVCFPPGMYLYFGSALNGLNGRIQRHLRREKKVHWHIDHLTSLASIEEVWWTNDGRNWECGWANETAGLPTRRVWSIAGFGSSDCGCSSHLHGFDSASNLDSVRRQLQHVCGRRFQRERVAAG